MFFEDTERSDWEHTGEKWIDIDNGESAEAGSGVGRCQGRLACLLLSESGADLSGGGRKDEAGTGQ